MNTTKEFLEPLNSSQKSFYKKAYYTKTETKSTINYRLYSYSTLVLEIFINKYDTLDSYYVVNDYTNYSMTTIKHVKEMLLQFLPNYEEILGNNHVSIHKIMDNGLTAEDLKEIDHLFGKDSKTVA